MQKYFLPHKNRLLKGKLQSTGGLLIACYAVLQAQFYTVKQLPSQRVQTDQMNARRCGV